MSIQNINIEGTATFNDTSSNYGEIQSGVFTGTSTNAGSVTVAATFEGSAENTGTVAVAVFTGSAVNTGTVTTAEFRDTASNAGTVTLSAAFADSAVNSGTIQGDAIFADTTSNSGTVQGDAQVAATATNSGTVQGTVTEYVPNNNPPAGTVLSTGNQNYITLNNTQYPNGTYDLIADGNGSSIGGNYQYLIDGTEFYNDGSVYRYVSDGNGGSRQEFIPSGTVFSTGHQNYITIDYTSYTNGTYDVIADGNGASYNNYQYPSVGTVIGSSSIYNYLADGSGGYTSVYVSGVVIQTGTNYMSINGNSFPNGTYSEIADGNGGSTISYAYPLSPILLGSDCGHEYYSTGDGTGNYSTTSVSLIVTGTSDATIDIPNFGTAKVIGTITTYCDSSTTTEWLPIGTYLGVGDFDMRFYSDGNGGYYTASQ